MPACYSKPKVICHGISGQPDPIPQLEMGGSNLLVATKGIYLDAAGKTTLIDILAGRKRDAGKQLLCC